MLMFGEQFVMTSGAHLMPKLHVDSWDSLLQVCIDNTDINLNIKEALLNNRYYVEIRVYTEDKIEVKLTLISNK